jgi:hypothetical protein
MYDPWTPRLLRRAAPDARILVLLRDPVARYRSGLAHQIGSTPRRPIEAMTVDALNRSRYALQLRRLHELFGAEQILVLQYERCREDTAGEYARTLRFLGVRDDFEPAEPRPLARIAAPKATLWPELAEELRAALEPDVRELVTLFPELDLALWPDFAHLAAMQPTS